MKLAFSDFTVFIKTVIFVKNIWRKKGDNMGRTLLNGL